jgi:DNA-directed RNA polymerase I, II, and III subunit RPABC2
MQKPTTASKYSSDQESVSASASEDEEVNSDEEGTSVKGAINKVKSILGSGDEGSDTETETETEGDDSDGEGNEEEGEGEGKEQPSFKSGFSKLLGSLKKAVSSIGSDTGSAAVEAEQTKVDTSSKVKGKPASSRRKKSHGIQPTEAELAYKSEDAGDENSDDEKIDDNDDDDSKLKKFDKELREDYLVNFHPESLIQNYDEIYNLSRVVRDANGVIVDNLHKTLPMMTKYEKTRILGQRAKQINDGATPFVKVPEGVIDGYLIAIKELEEKKIPFIIRRPLPNRGSEYWLVEDLEIII